MWAEDACASATASEAAQSDYWSRKEIHKVAWSFASLRLCVERAFPAVQQVEIPRLSLTQRRKDAKKGASANNSRLDINFQNAIVPSGRGETLAVLQSDDLRPVTLFGHFTRTTVVLILFRPQEPAPVPGR